MKVPYRFSTKKGSYVIIVSVILFTIAMAGLSSRFAFSTFFSDSIHNGVYVSGINVGNKSVAEAADIVKNSLVEKIDSINITLKKDNTETVFALKDIDFTYDIDEAVKKAYSIGRTGNLLRRIMQIVKAHKDTVNVGIEYSLNNEKLESYIDDFYKSTLISVRQPDIIISEEKVTAVSGRTGEHIDKEAVMEKVLEALYNLENNIVEVQPIITQPKQIKINEVLENITREPANATFKVENNEIIINNHVNGRKADKKKIEEFFKNFSSDGADYKDMEIDFIQPEMTVEKMQSMILRDILGAMTTKYSTNTQNGKNRADNIRLASDKITGIILAPGDIFSFNEIVGPRTREAGYKSAHVYFAGRVIDGIGGGICQVSTTLYNAALFADLEIIERRNHMFTVGYAPLGNDATISYGFTDFKFKNSTNWPIKLDAYISDNNEITFTLTGTNETPGKTIEIIPDVIKKMPYSTIYNDNPEWEVGKTMVKQEGKHGYLVDTYKIVKNDDEVISKTKLYSSKYIPLNKIVTRGTKEPVSEDNELEIPPDDNIFPEE